MISAANILKFVFLLISSLLFASCFQSEKKPPVKKEFKGDIFGSYYYIKYNGELDQEKFSQELESFFKSFNQEFSTYQKDSVINSFNEAAETKRIKVSPSFIEMLKLAQKLNKETNGAFDPTLGPVIKVWGFGGAEKKTAPSESKIKEALNEVGFKYINWDEVAGEVWKVKHGVRLDINAFAPGMAGDMIGNLLESHGVYNYMVDISGEILFKGTKENERQWIAGIEKPSPEYAQGIQIAFYIKDQAVATSGSYRQFFNDEGKQRSHIIDPRTGSPVDHKISSASVIAPTAAEADAWGTALMVLGREGIKLAEKNNLKVFLLEAKGPNSFEEIYSPAFKEYLKTNLLK